MSEWYHALCHTGPWTWATDAFGQQSGHGLEGPGGGGRGGGYGGGGAPSVLTPRSALAYNNISMGRNFADHQGGAWGLHGTPRSALKKGSTVL